MSALTNGNDDLTNGNLTNGNLTNGDLTNGDLTNGDLTNGDLTMMTFTKQSQTRSPYRHLQNQSHQLKAIHELSNTRATTHRQLVKAAKTAESDKGAVEDARRV
jgi:hypothetical protein